MKVIPISDVEEATRTLTKILNKPFQTSLNQAIWKKQVATPFEIKRDFNSPVKIRTIETDLNENLLIRAIVGHAQAGHCTFRDNKKKNTTLDEVIKHASEHPENFYEESQHFINQIGRLVDKALSKGNPLLEMKHKRMPLFGVPMYRDIIPLPFLKGIFFGGYFDNYPIIRTEAEKRFGIEIGGGERHLIDKEMLEKLNIGITELTSGNYNLMILNYLTPKERIQVFKNIGLIQEKKLIDLTHVERWEDVLDQALEYQKLGNLFQEFMRYVRGPGVSDDIACMNAAFIGWDPLKRIKNRGLYHKNLIVGANMTDLIDTLSKATALYVHESFDELIAKYANHMWLKKITENKKYREACGITKQQLEIMLEDPQFALVPRDEIINLVALSKNPLVYLLNPEQESDRSSKIHSSARYFLKEIINEEMEERSYTLEQEMIQTLRIINKILQEQGEPQISIKDVTKGTEHVLPYQKIGFTRQPLNRVFDYLRKRVHPITSLHPEKRETEIHYLYNKEAYGT